MALARSAAKLAEFAGTTGARTDDCRCGEAHYDEVVELSPRSMPKTTAPDVVVHNRADYRGCGRPLD